MPSVQFRSPPSILVLWLVCILGGGAGCSASPQTLTDGIGSQAPVGASNSSQRSGETGAGAGAACDTPASGCPCSTEGQTVECSAGSIHTGNYTSCQSGERTCSGGFWSQCVGKTVVQNADEVTQEYASPCPSGTRVRWGALVVEGLTPSNSAIVVHVQTAAAEENLDAARSLQLARFGGTSETSWTSPDVETALSEGGATSQAWLRVTLSLTPSSVGGALPTLASWQQGSTCVPAN